MSVTGVRSTVTTAHMTKVELARVWADHYGYTTTVRDAGWIRDPQGRAIVQGWAAFADKLASRGFIRVGKGIDWRRTGETPRIAV